MDFYIDDIFTKYDLTDTQKKIKKKWCLRFFVIFIYESEIVDVLNTLTLFDYGFFREVLKK